VGLRGLCIGLNAILGFLLGQWVLPGGSPVWVCSAVADDGDQLFGVKGWRRVRNVQAVGGMMYKGGGMGTSEKADGACDRLW